MQHGECFSTHLNGPRLPFRPQDRFRTSTCDILRLRCTYRKNYPDEATILSYIRRRQLGTDSSPIRTSSQFPVLAIQSTCNRRWLGIMTHTSRGFWLARRNTIGNERKGMTFHASIHGLIFLTGTAKRVTKRL